jgi:hypothetical protein
MKSLPRSKTPCVLSDSLDRRLSSYALAASAAGIGLLALSSPAEGKIVYTPAHVKIGPHSQFLLDLNHDGVTDFTFSNGFYSGSHGTYFWFLSIAPAQSNEVWGHTNYGYGWASAFSPNVRVGNNLHFSAGQREMASFPPGSRNNCGGPWANVRNRYLGLKFVITGKTHFGWARLNVSCPYAANRIKGTLTGYAYETVPNRPIVTGKERESDETGTGSQAAELGRLAHGADGSPTRRNRRSHIGNEGMPQTGKDWR